MRSIEQSERRKIRRENGSIACCNCGSTDLVELHHIVPLIAGGRDIRSNMVPLCTECHAKVHEWKAAKQKPGGRPRRTLPDGWDDIVRDYIFCRIGKKEMLQKLGETDCRTSDKWYLQEILKAEGIKAHKNNIDMIIDLRPGRCVGSITRESGKEDLYWEGEHVYQQIREKKRKGARS